MSDHGGCVFVGGVVAIRGGPAGSLGGGLFVWYDCISHRNLVGRHPHMGGATSPPMTSLSFPVCVYIPTRDYACPNVCACVCVCVYIRVHSCLYKGK